MIGTAAHQDFNIYSLDFDVIGQIDTSPCGNLILRVGRTSVGEDSWQRIAHVVLTRDEVDAFIAEIAAKMNVPIEPCPDCGETDRVDSGTSCANCRHVFPESAFCRHCQRPIILDGDVWVDPEATGDDSVWRETCDAHDTFIANHEPAER